MLKKNKKGFTLIETLIAIFCSSLVIMGIAVTFTVNTKFMNLEKAETIAQNIAKNLMNQKIKNESFEHIKSFLTSQDVNTTTSVLLFDSTNINDGELKASSLAKDILRLGNSKSFLKLTPLDNPVKKISAKIEILWNLDEPVFSTGDTIRNSTRKVELSSLTYEFNYMNTSEKKAPMAKPTLLTTLPVVPTATPTPDPNATPTTTPQPTATPDCNSPNKRPLACACSNNNDCKSGFCLLGVCSVEPIPTPTNPPLPTPTPDPNVTPTATPEPPTCFSSINKPLNCSCQTNAECNSLNCSNGKDKKCIP